jgi:hypothetical protein
MSESFAERLSRLTPEASGIDRDALMFAAGKASVRRGRVWPALAGTLAACQVLTLALLWPRGFDQPGPIAKEAPARMVSDPQTIERMPPENAVCALDRRLLTLEEKLESLPADSLTPDDPPLRVLGVRDFEGMALQAPLSQ